MNLARVGLLFSILVATALAVTLGLWTSLGAIDDGATAERVWPLSSVHLREEAHEGVYAPARDPVFIGPWLLIGLLGLTLPTAFFARSWSQRPTWVTVAPAVMAVFVLTGRSLTVVSLEDPATLVFAVVLQVLILIAATAAGVVVGRHSRRRGSHRGSSAVKTSSEVGP